MWVNAPLLVIWVIFTIFHYTYMFPTTSLPLDIALPTPLTMGFLNTNKIEKNHSCQIIWKSTKIRFNQLLVVVIELSKFFLSNLSSPHKSGYLRTSYVFHFVYAAVDALADWRSTKHREKIDLAAIQNK